MSCLYLYVLYEMVVLLSMMIYFDVYFVWDQGLDFLKRVQSTVGFVRL